MQTIPATIRLFVAVVVIILTASHSMGQVAINTSGNAPHASAILDVTSTSKGMLIPRMSTSDRNLIPSPATGLLIYNTTNNKYNFYSGTAWVELASGSSNRIIDADMDTKVDVEVSPDADYISMQVKGNELVAILEKSIATFFPGGSIAIGEEAGSQDDGTSNLNTTLGTSAGTSLISGEHNVNIGANTGTSNSVGSDNTYLGFNAGLFSQSSNNLFAGAFAGQFNTSGFENTFLGKDAGFLNSTGAQNVFVGLKAGAKNTTSSNTFIGAYAGSENTSGSGNTFIGKDAGLLNTTASNNLFAGFDAGHFNTTGTDNVFLGKDAGRVNTTTSYSVFVGSAAGMNNTAFGNTFIGATSGQSNTTGTNNTLLGFAAGNTLSNTSFNTMIGAGSGANTELGEKNTFLGYNTGQDNQASFNTFLGSSAGEVNQTGTENTFVGESAGSLNSTGSNNTFVGRNAGKSNTTSAGNTFVGRNAGMNNAIGAANTFVGQNAGNANTASNNTFIGQESGAANSTGTNNSFLGQRAGFSNSTGASNTFLGTSAGQLNSTGSNNTFIGRGAGDVNTASNNTFIGMDAGGANSTGTGNTFVGKNAGLVNTTAPQNTFVGFEAGKSNTASSNTFLGNSAGPANTTGSENTFIGFAAGAINLNGDGNVFMGVNSGGNNTTADNNTFVGTYSGTLTSTGSANAFFGDHAGFANTTGSHNTFIGNQARPTTGILNNATAIGDSALVGASNTVVLGNKASVGIGTSTPDPSAKTEIKSTTQGFLMPRMTSAQRKAIVTPAAGLLVFDTDKSALYFFDGATWLPMSYTPELNLPASERLPSSSNLGDLFGIDLAISGDYAIIGSPGVWDTINDNSNEGVAYIFKRINGSWIEFAVLTASDGAENDFFGTSVDIYGDYAVVGAPGDDANKGSAYIFLRNGNTWSQQAKITASGGAADDRFGTAVSIENNTAIVGAPFDDIGSDFDNGSVHVFNRTGTTWTQITTLTHIDMDSDIWFGHSVCLNAGRIAIGAPHYSVDNKGGVIIFELVGGVWTQTHYLSGTISQDNYGYSVSLNGNLMAIGSPNLQNSGGRIKVYHYNGISWVENPASSFVVTGGDYGQSVAITQDYLIVGDPYLNKTYVYSSTGTEYEFLREINDSNPHYTPVKSGYRVAVEGFNIISSDPGGPCGICPQYRGKVYFLNVE